MSSRRYSGRRYRRRRSPLPALLLVIVLAALVLGALAIFTDIFKKDTPADKPDNPAVTQPDDTQTPDDAQTPDSGDGQTGDTAPDDAQQPTGNKTVDTITTDATPYQSGGVYVVGSSGFEMYNYVDSLAKSYADIVTSVADQLSGVSTVYTLAVPLSSGITLPDALYSDIPGSDQAQAEKNILAAMGNNVKTVPLHDVLMSHRSEYIYFRTDHHWTALGAYYAYTQYAKAAGLTPHMLDQFEQVEFPNFLGTYYSVSGITSLGANPDTVIAYKPMGTNKMKMTMADGTTYDWFVVNDVSGYGSSMKYGAFAGGDQPYSVVENPEITDGSACLVIKDSYGNALIPYLVDHYQYLYWIDFRYYKGSIYDLVAEKNIKDVLVLQQIYNTGDSGALKKLQALVER